MLGVWLGVCTHHSVGEERGVVGTVSNRGLGEALAVVEHGLSSEGVEEGGCGVLKLLHVRHVRQEPRIHSAGKNRATHCRQIVCRTGQRQTQSSDSLHDRTEQL